jgi:hypothetical protein
MVDISKPQVDVQITVVDTIGVLRAKIERDCWHATTWR